MQDAAAPAGRKGKLKNLPGEVIATRIKLFDGKDITLNCEQNAVYLLACGKSLWFSD